MMESSNRLGMGEDYTFFEKGMKKPLELSTKSLYDEDVTLLLRSVALEE
jgi:hypothetical protein